MKIALVALVAILSVPSPAQETASPRPLALGGLDPVALCEGVEVEGREDWTAQDRRHSYRFANRANMARFRAEPDRFGIQWGGACGRMGPLSGRGDPARFAVHAGRIYIFASDGCRTGFLSAPEKFIVPQGVVAAPADEAVAAGREILEKVVAAHGAAALDALKIIRAESRRESRGWVGTTAMTVGLDGSVTHRVTWTPPETEDGEASEWLRQIGESAIEQNRTGRFELGAEETADLMRLAHRLPSYLLAARHEPGFSAALLEGEEKLGERSALRLRLHLHGLSTILLVDRESHRILALDWRGRLNDGVTRDIREILEDWRSIDGVLVPMARRIVRDSKIDEAAREEWSRIAFERR